MEKKQPKSSSISIIVKQPLEPVIINLLAIAGILSNVAGLFVAMSFPDNYKNILPTAVCLTFQVVVFLFRKKLPYSVTGVLLTLVCANILFPIILLSEFKGLGGSFVFYLFITPSAYGVVINKKRWLWLPLLTLAEYLILFVYIDKHLANSIIENVYLYSFGFSVSYLFILIFTFFFTSIAFSFNGQLRNLLLHDKLTGVYNRRKLDDDLQSQGFRFVAMMDVDNFHECNNEHGHHFGDLCLKKLADICLFVSCDEFKVYRYGGEEFVVLSRLPEADTVKKIKDIQNLYYKEMGITLSVGVAQNVDYLAPLQILKKADENMFFVKRNGKNNISLDSTSLIDKKKS